MKTEDLPKYEALFLDTPIYNSFEVNPSAEGCYYLYHLFNFNGKIDAFCPQCEKVSTFQGSENHVTMRMSNSSNKKMSLVDLAAHGLRENISIFRNDLWNVGFYCARSVEHKMSFNFYLKGNVLIKTGQYPSQAELTLPELRKYQSILSKEKYKELNRGIGLTAHGIGIGAFVYLRRVFEDLIEDAYQNEKHEDYWDDELYKKSRIKEQIQLLQHRLPKFLVDNNSIYSILSKGIHELSEKDCLDFFPAMKLSVELILDEKLERFQKEKKIAEVKASIAKIQAQISNE